MSPEDAPRGRRDAADFQMEGKFHKSRRHSF